MLNLPWFLSLDYGELPFGEQGDLCLAQVEPAKLAFAGREVECLVARLEGHLTVRYERAQPRCQLLLLLCLEALVGANSETPAPAPLKRPVRKGAGAVVRMSARKAIQAPSAEDELPMGDTGTYGKF